MKRYITPRVRSETRDQRQEAAREFSSSMRSRCGRTLTMSAAAGDGASLEATAKAEEDIRDVFRSVFQKAARLLFQSSSGFWIDSVQ